MTQPLKPTGISGFIFAIGLCCFLFAGLLIGEKTWDQYFDWLLDEGEGQFPVKRSRIAPSAFRAI
jgi:hypothetical protein